MAASSGTRSTSCGRCFEPLLLAFAFRSVRTHPFRRLAFTIATGEGASHRRIPRSALSVTAAVTRSRATKIGAALEGSKSERPLGQSFRLPFLFEENSRILPLPLDVSLDSGSVDTRRRKEHFCHDWYNL